MLKRKPFPIRFMAGEYGCPPPPDAKTSSIPRPPSVGHVWAENHPIELEDGDPDLDHLLILIGQAGLQEAGQFVKGGFRMVELVDPLDGPALPQVTTRTKLAANALAVLALRGFGGTIHGPYEEDIFLLPGSLHDLKEFGKILHDLSDVLAVFDQHLRWSEVPPVWFSTDQSGKEPLNEFFTPEELIGLFIYGP